MNDLETADKTRAGVSNFLPDIEVKEGTKYYYYCFFLMKWLRVVFRQPLENSLSFKYSIGIVS